MNQTERAQAYCAGEYWSLGDIGACRTVGCPTCGGPKGESTMKTITSEWYAKPTAGHETHGQSAIYSDDGPTIAIVYDGKAHANLLAAAPELLEALEEAERVIRWAAQESAGRVKAEIVGGWIHHANQARAAIAKARNRS